MKKKFIVLSVFVACLCNCAFSQPFKAKAHLGLFYPLSTNGKDAAKYTNRFSLHAIAGVSKNETGAIFSGLSGTIKDSAKGFEMAGFSNYVGKKAHGVQMAGFINYAGGGNASQFAGFSNVTKHDSAKLQVAGFVNKGATVGSQVAGFINVAKKVRGVQISGFINVADSSDYPIGFLNFIKSGEKQIGITVDESLNTILAFRSGGRVLYGIIGAGYNFKGNKHLYIAEGGIGSHLKVSDDFRINIEASELGLANFKKGSGNYLRASFSVLPSYKKGGKFDIFAGPTFNYVYYTNDLGKDITKHYVWSNSKVNKFDGLYIGGTLGVGVIF